MTTEKKGGTVAPAAPAGIPPSTSLATYKKGDVIRMESFALSSYKPEEIQNVVRENLAGMNLSLFDLQKIKVPAGGGISWEVTDNNGILDSVKSIDCAILLWKFIRGYWKDDLESGKTSPPDCKSDDGIVGVGNPGGVCEKCPLSKFGTDPKRGRGQACKQKIVLLALMPDKMFPQPIFVPPTSIKAVRSYFLNLTGQNRPFNTVLTNLALRKNKNADGTEYSEVVPTQVGPLEPDLLNRVRAFSEAVRPIFGTIKSEAKTLAE